MPIDFSDGLSGGGTVLDAAIAVLLPILAWTALAHPRVMAGVMLFITYGIILSLAWFRLDAPDVAIAEAAIGAGLTGVLLIGTLATLHRIGRSADGPVESGLRRDPLDSTEPRGRTERVIGMSIVAALAAGIAVVTILGLAAIPALAPQRAGPLALSELEVTGLGNAVNAVLLSFRALDTLLEKVVLIIALLGAVMIAAGRDRSAADAEGHGYHRVPADSDGPLGLLTGLILPVSLVTAGYLVVVGADLPGGAFQGGTVAAAGIIVAILAGRFPHPAPSSRLVLATGSAAIAAFAAVLAIGSVVGPGMAGVLVLAGDQKIVIILAEVALTIGIAVILASLALGDRNRWPQGGAALDNKDAAQRDKQDEPADINRTEKGP